MPAYETKVMLKQVTEIIAKSQTLKEAYTAVADSAGVEGVVLPPYEEKLREIEELRK